MVGTLLNSGSNAEGAFDPAGISKEEIKCTAKAIINSRAWVNRK